MYYYEATTSAVLSLSESALWYAQHSGTKCLQSNMAAGVQQDRMLIGPFQGMVDLTDVGMAKEDHGRMMFTECQVSQSNVLYRVILYILYQTRKKVHISKHRRIIDEFRGV